MRYQFGPSFRPPQVHLPAAAQPVGRDGLAPSAMRVLNALSSNPALAAAELSEELDLSPRQVQMATKELGDGGVIERVGSDKNGTWKILRHPMS